MAAAGGLESLFDGVRLWATREGRPEGVRSIIPSWPFSFVETKQHIPSSLWGAGGPRGEVGGWQKRKSDAVTTRKVSSSMEPGDRR